MVMLLLIVSVCVWGGGGGGGGLIELKGTCRRSGATIIVQ